MQMAELIADVRRRFNRAPRFLRKFTRRKLPVAAPHWMPADDGLQQTIRDQALLLREGHVVWGALVQANELLFEAGDVNCPAQLVYALSTHFDAMPEKLFEAAHGIYLLKHTSPADAAQAALAQMVTNETGREMGVTVTSANSAAEIRTSSFMVMREHVPLAILTSHWFPILIHPSTPSVMIVPECFWPAALKRMWRNRQLRGDA